MVYEYRLDEHNFQNQPGDEMLDMREMSRAGWEIDNSVIAFPYVHALWKREIGGKQPQAVGHSDCAEHISQLQAEAAQAREEAAVQVQRLQNERDAARDVARQLKAAKEQAENERDQLRAQLTGRQQP